MDTAMPHAATARAWPHLRRIHKDTACVRACSYSLYSYGLYSMAYIVMAYAVMACIVMACIVWPT